MRTRAIVLFTVILSLFSFSAGAQQYYRPYYTQKRLSEVNTARIFLENRTGGHLKVKLEVNGLVMPVEVNVGSEVVDLRLPVGAVVKIKEAKALAVDGKRTKYRDVKYYAYWRQDPYGDPDQQGWLFYLNKSFRP